MKSIPLFRLFYLSRLCSNSDQEEFMQNLSGVSGGKATRSNAPAGGLEKSIVFRDNSRAIVRNQMLFN